MTVTTAVSVALLYVYVEFIGAAISNGYLPQNDLEVTILAIQLAKLLAIFALPRLRRAGSPLIFDIFGIDLLILPVLTLLYLGVGDPIFVRAIVNFIAIQPVAVALVIPIYMIYSSARWLLQGGPLSTILPFASLAFGTLLFLWGAASTTGQAGGLSGLFRIGTNLLVGRASFSPDALSSLTSGGGLASGALLYLGLIGYAVIDRDSRSVTSLAGVLLLAILGTLLGVGWTGGLSLITRDALIVLMGPTIAIVGLLWLFSRAK